MATHAFPSYAKHFTTTQGTRYAYIFIPPASTTNATLLFLHGFPSSSYDWRHQITHFQSKGYGILVPDLLAYGGSDKPTDLSAYRGSRMINELTQILDAEKVVKVHGIAHDFGAFILSRLVNYHPDRVTSCAFLSVPYLPPAGHFDLQKINEMTKQMFGVEKFGYMAFFGEERASAVLKAHKESFFNLFYPDDAAVWDVYMRPTGALEAWISADNKLPLASYITEEEQAMHHRIFGGDYAAPLRWYRSAMLENCDEEEEKGMVERGMKVGVSKPVLLILETGEMVDEEGLRKLCSDFRLVRTSGRSHWVQLECKEEVNRYLEDFWG